MRLSLKDLKSAPAYNENIFIIRFFFDGQVYLDRLRELFSGVDRAPFEEIVNNLYTLEDRGRRLKPPIAYLRASW